MLYRALGFEGYGLGLRGLSRSCILVLAVGGSEGFSTLNLSGLIRFKILAGGGAEPEGPALGGFRVWGSFKGILY